MRFVSRLWTSRMPFGNVRHSFIQYALRLYHVPTPVRSLFWAYYDRLFAQVQTSNFNTNVFHYGIGVFQGCTASLVWYNVVMQMLLDLLHQDSHLQLGYTFGNVDPAESSVGLVLDPTFVDDLTLVTHAAAGGQFLLDKLSGFMLWSVTMRLKVPKCLALAFACRDGVGRGEWGWFDPRLTVGGQSTPVMRPEGCKHVGRRFDPSLFEDGVKAFLRDSLLHWMRLLDTTPLLGTMECWMYGAFIIPKLSWFFTIHDLSVSFVKASLHSLVLAALGTNVYVATRPCRGGTFCSSSP
jgi:hypothetical protein